MNPQFEYRVIRLEKSRVGFEVLEKFEELGKEGWELVCVDDYWAYFKRQIKK